MCFEPQPQPFEADAVVARINQITTWARKNALPVIFVQHEEPDTEIAYQTEGWQLHTDLITAEGDIFVRKTTPDSFHDTVLKTTLDRLEI
ncbi:isochorismatase family protein, partial [Photobacterium sp. R1]